MSFSLLYSVSFIGYVDRPLVRYLIAASLCSRWWQESFGMIKKTKYRLSQYLHLIIYDCTAIQRVLWLFKECESIKLQATYTFAAVDINMECYSIKYSV